MKWPVADRAALERDQVEVAVQVNGKLRGRMMVATGLDSKAAQAAALAYTPVSKWVRGKEVVKVIVVQDKLVNIVVR